MFRVVVSGLRPDTTMTGEKTLHGFYIFSKRLKSYAVCLYYSNSNMTGFAGVDISYSAGFTRMRTAYNFATRTVREFACFLFILFARHNDVFDFL